MSFKGYRFFGNRVLVTVCRQAVGAPTIDYCFTGDADGNRYEGLAVSVETRRRNEHGEHVSQRALVIATRNLRVARCFDPQKYRREWRRIRFQAGLARRLGLWHYLTNPSVRSTSGIVAESMSKLLDMLGFEPTIEQQAMMAQQLAVNPVPIEVKATVQIDDAAAESMDEARKRYQAIFHICTRCQRRNFMGRPLHNVGNRQMVCIDCFCFITGIDERDPLKDRTARSGDSCYLTTDEWQQLKQAEEDDSGVQIEATSQQAEERMVRNHLLYPPPRCICTSVQREVCAWNPACPAHGSDAPYC